MTTEQFRDIESKLAKWREERGLSVEEQKRNFRVNYSKELTEFYEAERDNNEYEMIDAMCDMLIVAINAGAIKNTINFKISSNFFSFGLENSINSIFCTFDILGYDPYLCLLETIKELETRTGKWCEKEGKWIKDLGAYTQEEARKKIEAMDNGVIEVIWAVLEEETQTHYIFEVEFGVEIQKVKIKKWHKADYSKCKIKEVENVK